LTSPSFGTTVVSDVNDRERDVTDAEDICGETYDHTLNLLSEADGMRVYECRECGAEIIEEDEEVDA
jgi:rubrerythrin